MYRKIKKQINTQIKSKNGKSDSTSLYSYEHISDTISSLSLLINTTEFHHICKLWRQEEDTSNDRFLDEAYLSKKNTGEFICSMREIQEQKDKEAQAEIQNFMASAEAHCKEYDLKSYMLTLTLSNQELKESSSYISIYEHSKLVHNQVGLLRYFMKIVYSDRLVKYHLNNFFWIRILEFTKIGNAHLHYKKISKNEYFLLDYSSSNFFKKGFDGAGQGFIIRVLTKRKNEQINKRSAVSRYIMKYLLKTRKNEKTEATIQRAVFSFLKINPFSFKRNVLFSLTKFRNIKNILIEEDILDKRDKHGLYTLTKALKDGSLCVDYEYEFTSLKS